MSGVDTISKSDLERMSGYFESDPTNGVISNIVQSNGVKETCFNKAILKEHDKGFSHKLSLEGKATSQKASGRCWLFAACNVIRQPIMRAFGLGRDWELSQNYLFFYDKLEKANWMLQVIADSVNADPDQCADRLWTHVLSTPQMDGGQYTMFIDIIRKYGLMPKSAYPDAHGSTRSQPVNWLVNNKLREAAFRIKQIYMASVGSSAGSSASIPEAVHATAVGKARAYAKEVVGQVYHLLATCLGAPPARFEWRVDEGGHGRTLRVADAQRVCAKWGEDIEVGDDTDTSTSTSTTWTPLQFLRLVVEPCMKHGWAEKLRPGKTCTDPDTKDKAKPSASAPGKASAQGPPGSESSECSRAVPRGEGLEGDERAEELARLSRPPRDPSPSPSPSPAPAASPATPAAPVASCSPPGASPCRDYLSRLVSLVHDPRHGYWRPYTVDRLGAVRGGDAVVYVNVPAPVLLRAITYALAQRRRPVWFGCDAGKYGERDRGVWDPAAWAYKATLGTDAGTVNGAGATAVRGGAAGREEAAGGVYGKRERVLYGESLMTHAMTFTGVDARPYPPAGPHAADAEPEDLSGELEGDAATEPLYVHRLRVENSWGEDKADKGYYSISHQYFHEFCFQAVIHQDDMTDDVRDKVKQALQMKPTVMPLWDPMGALAM